MSQEVTEPSPWVLLVDDDDDFAAKVPAAVLGFVVHRVSDLSGAFATLAAAADPPKAILLDCYLGGHRLGSAAIPEFRRVAFSARLVVISTSEETAMSALEADSCAQKPAGDLTLWLQTLLKDAETQAPARVKRATTLVKGIDESASPCSVSLALADFLASAEDDAACPAILGGEVEERELAAALLKKLAGPAKVKTVEAATLVGRDLCAAIADGRPDDTLSPGVELLIVESEIQNHDLAAAFLRATERRRSDLVSKREPGLRPLRVALVSADPTPVVGYRLFFLDPPTPTSAARVPVAFRALPSLSTEQSNHRQNRLAMLAHIAALRGPGRPRVTQRELAKSLGIPTTTLHGWLSSEHYADVKAALAAGR
jgi:ActR/RegA family two-component response regulator